MSDPPQIPKPDPERTPNSKSKRTRSRFPFRVCFMKQGTEETTYCKLLRYGKRSVVITDPDTTVLLYLQKIKRSDRLEDDYKMILELDGHKQPEITILKPNDNSLHDIKQTISTGSNNTTHELKILNMNNKLVHTVRIGPVPQKRAP